MPLSGFPPVGAGVTSKRRPFKASLPFDIAAADMLLGELDVNGGPALASLHKISEGFEKLDQKIKTFAAGFAGIGLAFEAISKIGESMEGVLTMSEHMNSLHNATGDSVHDLTIFSHELDLVGVGAESAQGFIFKLQQALSGVNEEGKSTATALQALGLTQQELAGKGILEQMEMLSRAFANVASQEDKAAIAGDLFGKKMGANALRIIANPEALETAIKQGEPLAAMLDKNSGNFEALGHAIDGVKISLEAFFTGMMEGVAGPGKSLADALAGLDLATVGEGFGHILGFALNLAKPLEALIPLFNQIAKALDEMSKHSTVLGALAGGAAGFALGGPLGMLTGGALGAAAGILFGDESNGAKKGGGNKSGSGSSSDDSLPKHDSPVGFLQRMGLGGAFLLTGGNDAVLSEAQRHTQYLQSIDAKLSSLSLPNNPGIGMAYPPV